MSAERNVPCGKTPLTAEIGAVIREKLLNNGENISGFV
jgi:hypothetical protein